MIYEYILFKYLINTHHIFFFVLRLVHKKQCTVTVLIQGNLVLMD